MKVTNHLNVPINKSFRTIPIKQISPDSTYNINRHLNKNDSIGRRVTHFSTRDVIQIVCPDQRAAAEASPLLHPDADLTVSVSRSTSTCSIAQGFAGFQIPARCTAGGVMQFLGILPALQPSMRRKSWLMTIAAGWRRLAARDPGAFANRLRISVGRRR